MLAMYSGTATLDAEADAKIVAKVGGEVLRILVEEGDHVKAGQVLAVLDDRQLRFQAAQTRAALAKAERDFNRQVELHEKGLVSAGAFEGLKYDLDNQRAADDIARLNLSYSEIRAPFAGIVSERNVKLGQEISIGFSMFRVTDPTPLKAAVYVPERELARLKPGQTASISVDALAGRTFTAIVKLVAPTVDATTATFKGNARSQRSEGRPQARHVLARRHRVRAPCRGADHSAHRAARHRWLFEHFCRHLGQGRATRHQDRLVERRQGGSDRRPHRHRAGGGGGPERTQERQSGTRRIARTDHQDW
jgi:multidrug resistance efflux pump